LVFLGTKDFALPCFERLADSPHELVGLITQPDRPQGRRQELIPSPIKLAALRRGIVVHQPESINSSEGVELLGSLKPDLLVTAAYGQILSPEVLEVPSLGGINLHGSILPKYRGAAPVARAIQAGEKESGVTVIRMSPRVDAGGMIAIVRTAIGPEETAGELEARLAVLGAPLMVEVVDRMAEGPVQILAQDGTKATKAPKLGKDDGRIGWTRPATAIHDLVRAMQPWPTASTEWHGDGKPTLRLIVHRAEVVEGSREAGVVLEAGSDRLFVSAGHGAIRLLTLQGPGKRAMPAGDFLRGQAVRVGELFV